MALDPRIILAGQPVNVLGAMSSANQMAAQQGEFRHQNALRSMLQENGPGIMAGDQNALSQLSRFDPNAAFGIKADQERLRLARAAAARAAAASKDKERLRAELAQATNGLKHMAFALRSGDERAWSEMSAAFGVPGIPMDANSFALVASTVQGLDEGVRSGMIEAVTPPKGEAPLSPAGKLAEDLRRGVITQAQYDAAVQGTPLVDFSGANFGGAQGGGAVGAVTPPNPDPPRGAEEAFGLEGWFKNSIVNRTSDFLGLGEVFPNAAEQQRFFLNLEEDMLVGLSQAYGRQPAQQLMERLRSLLPNSGTLEGAERAFGELVQMENRFRADLETNIRIRSSNQRMNQSDRQQLNARIEGLSATLNRMEEARMRFSKGSDWPKPGQIVDDHMYMGGDPADQKNWEKVN